MGVVQIPKLFESGDDDAILDIARQVSSRTQYPIRVLFWLQNVPVSTLADWKVTDELTDVESMTGI